MTNATHTPGPWTWGSRADDDANIDKDGPGRTYLILCNDDTCATVLMPHVGVCFLQDDTGRDNGTLRVYLDVSDANARLIAAAPDLLAACVQVVNTFGPAIATPEQDAAWKAAYAALEKAGAI